jgi:hypothetical protein
MERIGMLLQGGGKDMNGLRRFSLAALAVATLIIGALPAAAATITLLDWANGGFGPGTTVSAGMSVPFDGSNLMEPAPAGFVGVGFGPTSMTHSIGNPALLTISMSGLPIHTSLNVGFLLAVIDSWDGSSGGWHPDILNIVLDGTSIYSRTFDNFNTGDQTASTANLVSFGTDLGFSSWPDSVYDFQGANGFLNVLHTNSSAVIEFIANGGGWQGGGSDESFGLDKILVSANTPDTNVVPEPSTVILLGTGLLGLFGLNRRRRKA